MDFGHGLHDILSFEINRAASAARLVRRPQARWTVSVSARVTSVEDAMAKRELRGDIRGLERLRDDLQVRSPPDPASGSTLTYAGFDQL
jgi:hypothetical protein